MFCSKCGTQLNDGVWICANCGQQIEKIKRFCRICGSNIDLEQRCCPKCKESIDFIDNLYVRQTVMNKKLRKLEERDNQRVYETQLDDLDPPSEYGIDFDYLSAILINYQHIRTKLIFTILGTIIVFVILGIMARIIGLHVFG